ncbi:MAG: FAD/NAD(P)-binding protein [Granulosicoccus sp.]
MKRYTNIQPEIAELAFVGLGISNTSTLMHLLSRLIETPPREAISILLIERHEDHYTGVAYGPRSGSNSLLISTLEDFIGERERHKYIDWLKLNEGWLIEKFRIHGGELSEQWIDKFRKANHKTLESELCVPRSFFGYYMREQVNTLIDKATALGLIKIRSFTAEVVDMAPTPGCYALELSDHYHSLLAKKVILGIGPPACTDLQQRSVDDTQTISHVVNDPYSDNIGLIFRDLAKQLVNHSVDEKINVFIIGSNASAIEASYLLFDQERFASIVNKVFILSPSGVFPQRRLDKRNTPKFKSTNLIALQYKPDLTADDIYQAALEDHNACVDSNQGSSLSVVSFKKEIGELLHKLSHSEKAKFAGTYGVSIGKLQRRAGDEYLDTVDRLTQNNKLEHIKGRFVEITSSDDHCSTIEYVPEGADEAIEFPHKLSLIINCLGSRSLRSPQNNLIDKLVSRGICQINESGRGFVVDDDYSAARNLLVTGPLISGNVIQGNAVWHVEHCGRLSMIAEGLAESLRQDLVEPLLDTVAA